MEKSLLIDDPGLVDYILGLRRVLAEQINLTWPKLADIYASFEQAQGVEYFRNNIAIGLLDKVNNDQMIFEGYRHAVTTHHVPYLIELLHAEHPDLRPNMKFQCTLVSAVHLAAAHFFSKRENYLQAFRAMKEAIYHLGPAELLTGHAKTTRKIVDEEQQKTGAIGGATKAKIHHLPRQTVLYNYMMANPKAIASTIVNNLRVIYPKEFTDDQLPAKNTIYKWFNEIKNGWTPDSGN